MRERDVSCTAPAVASESLEVVRHAAHGVDVLGVEIGERGGESRTTAATSSASDLSRVGEPRMFVMVRCPGEMLVPGCEL